LTGRRSQRSAEATAYRSLYNLQAWRRRGGIREQVLIRDGYTCKAEGCGRLLIGKPPAPDSPVVHHLQDHQGDRGLFLDPANLEARCKACHDRHEQQRAHGTLAPAIGVDGWVITD